MAGKNLQTSTPTRAAHSSAKHRIAARSSHPFSALRQTLGNRDMGRVLQAQYRVSPPDSQRERAAAARESSKPAAPTGAAPRIHTGEHAAEAAQSVGARAFTVGSDIVFNRGEYAPHTPAGSRLLAHEMAHVAQNQADPAGSAGLISRQPTSSGAQNPPADPPRSTAMQFHLSDVLGIPLLKDIWRDLVQQKLTDKERSDLKLKGTEGAAFYAWYQAALEADIGTAGSLYKGQGFSTALTTTSDYLTALQPLTPTKDVVFDGFSRIVGLRIDDYLASDLFMLRLKTHPLSAAFLLALAQGGYSLAKGVISPAASGPPTGTDIGKFSEDWTMHVAVLRGIVGAAFKEQLKAPTFFDIPPLQLKPHPAFNFRSFETSGAPDLAAEYDKGQGDGQGGSETKVAGTLNIAQIAGMFDDKHKSDYFKDLSKYRGLQLSLWGAYDKLVPSQAMTAGGRLPEERIKAGAVVGAGGLMFLLETGRTYTGAQADALGSMFLHGGLGYAGAGDSPLKRIGFDFVYRKWTPNDVLAPGADSGSPVGGEATKLTPFVDLQFGDKNKFGVSGSASFVVGSSEKLDFAGFTGGVSYTYLGNAGKDQLPAFKIELGASQHRLDWFNQNSPVLRGLQLKTNLGPYFGSGEIMTGADKISTQRAAQFDSQTGARQGTAGVLILGRVF